MNVLFAVCMREAEHSMNVTWRTTYALSKFLESKGHTTAVISIIADSGASKSSMTNRINSTLLKKWDRVVIVYSSWYIHKDTLNRLTEVNKSAKWLWVTTDYEISTWLPHYDGVISNFEESFFDHKKKKFYDKYLFSNLNALIYEGINAQKEKKYDCIYYGRFREDRTDYIKKYDCPNLYLSTSNKNIAKYRINGIRQAKYIQPLIWQKGQESLNLFRCYLYLEDKTTHKYFNNLANRFYEGLTCRAVPLIDVSCKNTMEKSGYRIPEILYVDGANDLLDRVLAIKRTDMSGLLEEWNKQALAEKKSQLELVEDFIKNV